MGPSRGGHSSSAPDKNRGKCTLIFSIHTFHTSRSRGRNLTPQSLSAKTEVTSDHTRTHAPAAGSADSPALVLMDSHGSQGEQLVPLATTRCLGGTTAPHTTQTAAAVRTSGTLRRRGNKPSRWTSRSGASGTLAARGAHLASFAPQRLEVGSQQLPAL